jgi:hypothetical protein
MFRLVRRINNDALSEYIIRMVLVPAMPCVFLEVEIEFLRISEGCLTVDRISLSFARTIHSYSDM